MQDCVCTIVKQCPGIKTKENIQMYSKGRLQELVLEEVEGRMQESQISLEFFVAVSLKWKYSFLEVREDLIIFRKSMKHETQGSQKVTRLMRYFPEVIYVSIKESLGRSKSLVKLHACESRSSNNKECLSHCKTYVDLW